MVVRQYRSPGRLIVSRPGFAASPSMPNEQKILDSDWGYAGMLIASGEAMDPAPSAGGQYRDVTNSPFAWLIDIPDVGYTPTLIWGVEATKGSETIFFQQTYVGHFLKPPRIVNNNRIRIERFSFDISGSGAPYGRLGQPQFFGGEDYADMKFVYHVFGF